MKKAVIFVLMAILVMVPISSAQSSSEKSEAGITPNSIFYGFDLFFERIQLSLIKEDERKTDYQLDRVSERIAEIQVIMQDGLTEGGGQGGDGFGGLEVTKNLQDVEAVDLATIQIIKTLVEIEERNGANLDERQLAKIEGIQDRLKELDIETSQIQNVRRLEPRSPEN